MCNYEEMRLKSEAEEQAHLKAEEEARIAEELRPKAKAKEQSEEEAHFSDELRLKAERWRRRSSSPLK